MAWGEFWINIVPIAFPEASVSMSKSREKSGKERVRTWVMASLRLSKEICASWDHVNACLCGSLGRRASTLDYLFMNLQQNPIKPKKPYRALIKVSGVQETMAYILEGFGRKSTMETIWPRYLSWRIEKKHLGCWREKLPFISLFKSCFKWWMWSFKLTI